MAETEDALRVEVLGLCRLFCAQLWDKALNQAKVEAFSMLRRAESVYDPLPIRASSLSIANPDVPPEATDPKKSIPSKVLPSSSSPPKVVEQLGANKKVIEETKVVASNATKPLAVPQDPAKDIEAPRMEIVLTTLLIPFNGDPKGTGQGSSEATIP